LPIHFLNNQADIEACAYAHQKKKKKKKKKKTKNKKTLGVKKYRVHKEGGKI
jgi:hypothetical protein